MLIPSGSRLHRYLISAGPLLLVLAVGISGWSQPSEQADVAPATVESDAGPLSGVTFVPLPPDPVEEPVEDEAQVDDPAGPGALEPGDHPRPWTWGDDGELDELWNQCETGNGNACDDLFDTAPVGSDYERFGLTCGDRPGVVNCSDIGSEPRP